MARDIKDKKVAILTENGFEEVELTSPMNALEQAGATVHVISPQKDKVKIILTSGASCPDAVIERVLRKLLSYFPNAKTEEEAMNFVK